MRHAQANDKQPGETDRQRMLDRTGLQNATKMGLHFKEQDLRFDQIITSPAERAYMTALLISEQLKLEATKIHQNEVIYEASVRTLLQTVNQLKDQWDSVLLIGHNPTVTYLTEYLSKAEIGNIATCGVVQLTFDSPHWEEVSEGTGQLVTYDYPEKLNF